MSDAVDRYLRLAEGFSARVEATPDDAWDRPSPCEGWTARDVVAHMIGLQRRLAAAVDGGPADELEPGADPKAAWRESFAHLRTALADETALQRSVASPMGDMPLEFVVGRVGASDVLVHTWDLARAVGGDEHLDQDAVAKAYSGLKPVDAMLRQPGAFGPKVEPPEGADLQTEFLCFLGRRV